MAPHGLLSKLKVLASRLPDRLHNVSPSLLGSTRQPSRFRLSRLGMWRALIRKISLQLLLLWRWHERESAQQIRSS